MMEFRLRERRVHVQQWPEKLAERIRAVSVRPTRSVRIARHRSLLLQGFAAVCGGLVGYASPIPAGAFFGSMAGVAVVASQTEPAPFPSWLRDLARMLTGTAAGALVSRNVIVELGWALAWGAFANMVIIGIGLFCGYLFAKWSGIDRPTAMLAFSPGGIVEIATLADESDVQSHIVIAVHLIRRLLTLAVLVLLLSALVE